MAKPKISKFVKDFIDKDPVFGIIFVGQALENHADYIINNQDVVKEELAKTFISADALIDTAKRFKKEYKEHNDSL